jgi:ubiquinol-cytochrome c reductase iron-sulfur subunit
MTQGPRNPLLRALTALLALVFGRRGARRPPAPRPARPQNRRAENLVLALFGVATLAAVGFVVDYVAHPNTQVLGACLGGGLLLLGVAAALAGKRVLPADKAVEEYPAFGDEARQVEVEQIVESAGEGVSRRRLLIAAGGAAGVTLGVALVVPAASLGPRVGDKVFETPWRRGRRLVDTDGLAIAADAVTEGTFVNAFPEGADRDTIAAPVIVVRIPQAELDLPSDHRAGAPEGILAFSKVCPHAGCAVSMYRHPLYPPTAPEPALVCPCHYSTFDPRRGGTLVFGPAGRKLPQLPLQINASRELEAVGDFYDPVGPSYAGIRRR